MNRGGGGGCLTRQCGAKVAACGELLFFVVLSCLSFWRLLELWLRNNANHDSTRVAKRFWLFKGPEFASSVQEIMLIIVQNSHRGGKLSHVAGSFQRWPLDGRFLQLFGDQRLSWTNLAFWKCERKTEKKSTWVNINRDMTQRTLPETNASLSEGITSLINHRVMSPVTPDPAW